MSHSWQHVLQPTTHATTERSAIGHITSVDIAHKARFALPSIIGIKRPHSKDSDRDDDVISRPWSRSPHMLQSTSRLPVNKLSPSAISPTYKTSAGHNVSRDNIKSTPGPTQNPLLSLRHPRYDLPLRLIANFENLGVRAIYPWQSSCLLGKGLLDGQRNLIYTAPTGGGKSLVADVVMLRHVINNSNKKAILVLPYVALVQEKIKWLRRVVDGVSRQAGTTSSQFSLPELKSQDLEIRISGFFGGRRSKTTWSDCDIAVCTIEKANSLVNEAMEEGKIDRLGVVIIDELHLIDDQHRGYLIEIMMTKLISLQAGIQFIGMSATISNPKLLATWLQAKFYTASYRPIPIQEHLVYENAIYGLAGSNNFLQIASQLHSTKPGVELLDPTRTIAASEHIELRNPLNNAAVALAIETALAGYGALVFCNSRHGAQTLAALISKTIPTTSITDDQLDKRMDMLASLQALPGGFETDLSLVIPTGVAFHHAGLTLEEREIVAEGYDAGVIKIMVATCSLGAGINLPARRVIIHGARMGRDIVGPALLRQMRGRAGRKGKDEIGETYMCCQKSELEVVAELLEAELPAIVSSLTPEKRGLKRSILEAIAVRLASSHESLTNHLANSLLWHTEDHEIVLQMLDEALAALLRDGLILRVTDNAYSLTMLGSATVAAGLTPEDGVFVHSELRRALSDFVLDTELHILYLFTPIPQLSSPGSLTSDISWTRFRDLIDDLDDASLRAIRLIGINPATVNHMVNAGLTEMKENSPTALQTARTYRRMYSTFALMDLCNEVPISKIASKYNLPRGTIQNLAQSCHGFAAGMIKFCQRMASSPQSLSGHSDTTTTTTTSTFTTAQTTTTHSPSAGFSMLSTLLEHMLDRLHAGARPDLLDMARVTFVKGRMARLLYEEGFRGVRALSEADPKRDILPVMLRVSGWKAAHGRGNVGGKGGGGDDNTGARVVEDDVKERKRKLEAKLLVKAEILVKSAARIWERECVMGRWDEE